MINREIIYERNVAGSYMKIPVGMDAGLDERLMLRRKLPGLLPVEKAYVDGCGQYWYNISGRQSLDTYCRVRQIGMEFIERLIISICSELEILEWNLIHSNCLMLDPELIFITNSSREFIFTIYPCGTHCVENEFQQMMEYLLTRLDHKDTEAVRAAYDIYDKTLQDGYSIRDIRDGIVSARQKAGGSAGTAALSAGTIARSERESVSSARASTPPARASASPARASAPLARASASPARVSAPPERAAIPPERTVLPREKPTTRPKLWQGLRQKLVEWGFLDEAPQSTAMAERTSNREKRAEKKERKGKHGVKSRLETEGEVIYPQEEIAPLPQPVIRPTVCLNSLDGKPRGFLLYQGRDRLEDITLGRGMTRIGNGNEADVWIDRDTISRMHARIDCEENCYYIEDLNSTNGTFVNEEPLAYKERRRLQMNDIVSFADVRYRFT